MLTRTGRVVDSVGLALSLSRTESGHRRTLWRSAPLVALTGENPAVPESRLFAVADAEFFEGLYGQSAQGPPPTATLQATRPDGSIFWDQVTVHRVELPEGTHWVTSHEDVSAQVDAGRERSRLLASVTESAAGLRRILQVTEVLSKESSLAHAVTTLPPLLVPSMAQWVTVRLTSLNGDEWSHWANRHEDGAFPTAFERDVDTLMPTQVRESRHYAVLRGRIPYSLVSPVTEAALSLAVPPEAASAMREMRLGSVLAVPLIAKGAVTGLIVFGRAEDQPPFTDYDVDVARLIGQRAGNGLWRVAQAEERRRRSIKVQVALLPELPALTGLSSASVYRPSAVHAWIGGDWYDLFPLEDGRVLVSIGDVCGHDARSAAAMASYRTTIRASLWQGDDPGAALDRLDALLAAGPGPEESATAIVATVDRSGPDAFRLTYTTAGHPSGVVLTPQGTLVVLDDARATPIGFPPLAGSRPVETIELPYGSILVMYTDGIVERRTVPLRERIADLHATLERVPRPAQVEDVRVALFAMNDSRRLEDDVCAMIVRIDRPDAGAVSAR